MSTPSTATAPIPPHTHYGHSYHQSYPSSSSQHSPNDSMISGSSRLAHSYTSAYPRMPSASTRNSVSSTRPQPATATAQSTSQSSGKMPKNNTIQKQPDWREFYKNGVPSEIIVIDDDTPPPAGSASQPLQPHTSTAAATQGSSTSHVNKKRRTAVNYDGQNGYSDVKTEQYTESGSGTISTDRTTSLHTTAPTSLGSVGSRGAANEAHTETTAVGQKRKRVTRQSVSDTKKRQAVESDQNPFNQYIPPSKPLYKSKEVQVKPIKDVSSATTTMISATNRSF
jgi:dual-specificity kinase